MQEAPVRQYQLEFAVPEETFLQNVKLGEDTIDDMEQKLNQGEDVKDILRKYKVVMVHICEHVPTWPIDFMKVLERPYSQSFYFEEYVFVMLCSVKRYTFIFCTRLRILGDLWRQWIFSPLWRLSAADG